MPATVNDTRLPVVSDDLFLQKPITRLVFAWTSVAAGTVTQATTHAYSGLIRRVVTVPDPVAIPTNLYNVQLNDADGLDLLMTLGAGRSNVNTQQIQPLINTQLLAINSVLTLQIQNAGMVTQGQVIVYIE